MVTKGEECALLCNIPVQNKDRLARRAVCMEAPTGEGGVYII